jgi:hypothetical protein
MAEPRFKILIGSGGTFTPLSHQPALETLDEAKDEAKAELARQLAKDWSDLNIRAIVEETHDDGTHERHDVE